MTVGATRPGACPQGRVLGEAEVIALLERLPAPFTLDDVIRACPAGVSSTALLLWWADARSLGRLVPVGRRRHGRRDFQGPQTYRLDRQAAR